MDGAFCRTPVISKMVWKRSIDNQLDSDIRPLSIIEGQEIQVGTLKPPSYILCLPSR